MKSTENIEQSVRKLTVASSDPIHDRILGSLATRLDASKRTGASKRTPGGRPMTLGRLSRLAAAGLIVGSSLACLVLSRKVANLEDRLQQAQAQQHVAVPEPDNSATINLYLKEHQDVVARHASQTQTHSQPAQIQVSAQDVLYYEVLDQEPEYMSPGIIVRGPVSPNQISTSEAPVISNGHTLTLSEARETSNFELRAPARLYPGYVLDQIRRIEGRDALQLLYTNGIDSISLFEQPRDGERGLEVKDFREYAVYRQKKQAGGTILAWRDHELSYVLVGNIEMSQLMDMAQSISVTR